jgi:membrane-associated phospholipid phosphatase
MTFLWSYLGSTEMVAGVCLLVSALVLWLTRDWRLSVVPAIAIMLQLSVYLAVIALVRRERPSVERLEALLPMSSYPSGHVGASTALYLAFILLASRIGRVGLRRAVTAVCIAVPLLVAFGRLYRGMHHVSDIVAGVVVGVVCALLAYGWYLHRVRTASDLDRHRPSPA